MCVIYMPYSDWLLCLWCVINSDDFIVPLIELRNVRKCYNLYLYITWTPTWLSIVKCPSLVVCTAGCYALRRATV